MEIGIFTKGLPEQAQQRAAGLEGMPATSGEAIGASFDEALRFNPAASLFRAARRAMGESPMLAPEEAAARYGLDGRLKFSEPTPEHVARDLYELKLQELRLQSIQDRSPGGALQMLGSLGAGFAGSALDPINIASAFVPVVGATRMAAWSAAWGVNRARLTKGAAEGAVGAAVVEPLVFGVARAEQADYDALDSLLNVTFGAALGGGLHWAGGAIGDAFSGRRGGPPGVPPTSAPPAGPAQLGNPAGPATPTPAPPGAARLEPTPDTPPGAALLPDELEAYAPPIPTVPPPAAPPLLTLAVDSQPLAWREAALRTAVVELATFGEIRGLDGQLLIPGAAAVARGQVVRAATDAAATLTPELDAPLPVAQAIALARGVEPELVAALPTARAADLVERTPEQLRVDADLFQFKSGGDAAGVTDRLRGVKTWDQKLAGITLVWQRADGVEFIADGHQRHGLATRLAAEGQAPRLNAYLLREVDGYSAAAARIFAAFKNIAEGSGSALDAARVLREARLDPAMARYADQLPPLPPSSPLVRDAASLAELGDNAFRMVINEVVDQAHAAHVGRLIRDPQQQVAALGVLARAEPRSSNEARLLVEQIREAGFSTGQQQTLFGADAFAKSLFVQRAKVLDRAMASLRKDKAVFSTLIDESGRITAAGNALSVEANQRRLSDNETLILLLADATRAGSPIARELDDAARRLDAGEPVTRVAAAFLEAVRARISAGLDLGQLSGRAGPDGETPGSAGPAGAGSDQVTRKPPDPSQGALFEAPPAYGTPPPPALLTGPPDAPGAVLATYQKLWDGRSNDDEGMRQLRAQLLADGQRTGLEHLTAIDIATGELTHAVSGQRNFVSLTPDMQKVFGDPARRVIIQHNHPSNSSLSGADIATMISLRGVVAIAAHGHKGADYVAARGRGIDIRFASPRVRYIENIDDIRKFVSDKVLEIGKQVQQLGKATPEQLTIQHQRLVNVVMSRLGLIEYADTLSLDELKLMLAPSYRNMDELVDTLAFAVKDRALVFAVGKVKGTLPLGNPVHEFVLQQEAFDAGENWRDTFDRLAVALRTEGGLARLLARDTDAAAGSAGSPASGARGPGGTSQAQPAPERPGAAAGGGPGVVRPEPGFDPGQRQGRLLEGDETPGEGQNPAAGGGSEQAATQAQGDDVPPSQTQQDGQQQAAPVVSPTESVETAASLDGEATRISRSQSWATGRDLKLALQENVRQAAAAAGVDLTSDSPETMAFLTRMAVRDAIEAFKTNANAVGWYDEKTRQALAVMALVHPEIATDELARFRFTWALAVTSNGLRVDKNFELAEQVYRRMKENAAASGEMPTDLGGGKAQAAINKSLGLFNSLQQTWGIDNLRRFMLTEWTVSQITAIDPALSPSGEFATEVVRGAAILGPKIGNGFFANLYGFFDALTMDRWLIRSWGRWTGTLIQVDEVAAAKGRDRLRSALGSFDVGAFATALRKVTRKGAKGQDLEVKVTDRERMIAALEAISDVAAASDMQLDTVANMVGKGSAVPQFRALMDRIGDDGGAAATAWISAYQDGLVKFAGKKGADALATKYANDAVPARGDTAGKELRNSSNNQADILDGQKEDPADPAERRKIREVFRGALAELQKRPEFASLNMSDLQALLWYAEKRLYETAKEDAVPAKTPAKEGEAKADAKIEPARVAGYTDDEAPDYANAAAAVARERGVSERRIQAALTKEEQNGRAGKARSGDAGLQASAGQPPEAGGFAGGEKRNFVGDVATRRVRSDRGRDAESPGSYAGGGRRDGKGVRLLKPKDLGGVTAIERWSPTRDLKQVFRSNEIAAPDFFELAPGDETNAQAFAAAITGAKGRFGAAVDVKTPADYAGMRLFLSQDGRAGFAIKPDGDIVSVFSGGGAGRAVMELAVAAGGRKLDAYDTILPQFYAAHGFRAVARLKWDDSQAPVGWDKTVFAKYNGGEPDIVFMVYDPSYTGRYSPRDGAVFKGATAYDRAVKAQARELDRLERANLDGATPAEGSRRGFAEDDAQRQYVDQVATVDGQRNQGSRFETADGPDGPTVRQEVVIAETGERFEMERPAVAVLVETETRVERLKRALACLRQ